MVLCPIISQSHKKEKGKRGIFRKNALIVRGIYGIIVKRLNVLQMAYLKVVLLNKPSLPEAKSLS
jgi:hypothetical protein